MRSLFFYVLRQITGPFLLFTLLLTLVVWMTQSLRLLDLVINRGQSAVIFAYLTMLMLPSRTFQNCGSSSNLVFLIIFPTRVTRGSFLILRNGLS